MKLLITGTLMLATLAAGMTIGYTIHKNSVASFDDIIYNPSKR